MGTMHHDRSQGLRRLTRRTIGSSVSVETEHQSGQCFDWRPLGWWPHDGCHVSYGKGRGCRSQASLDGGAFDGSSVRDIPTPGEGVRELT